MPRGKLNKLIPDDIMEQALTLCPPVCTLVVKIDPGAKSVVCISVKEMLNTKQLQQQRDKRG